MKTEREIIAEIDRLMPIWQDGQFAQIEGKIAALEWVLRPSAEAADKQRKRT